MRGPGHAGGGSPAGGPLRATLAAVAGWLVEPAHELEPPRRPQAVAPLAGERPVVAVTGLGRRCGTTTVARALGAQLAVRDPGGACAVTTRDTSGVPALGLPAAGRLARALAPVAGGRVRAHGRLCLVEAGEGAAFADAARHLAPLVIDVEDPAHAPAAAAVATAVVVCGSPRVERALAAVLAASLARVGPEPLVVLNRAPAGDGWPGADAELPEARMGARLALGGREPRGELGRAVAALADLVERGA